MKQVGGNMAEKLTMKSLSADITSMAGEIETLRKKLAQLDRQMNRKIETATRKAVQDYLREAGMRRNQESHGPGVDAAERQRLIAEQRGFSQGDPAQDWLSAEEEVNRMLMSGDSG